VNERETIQYQPYTEPVVVPTAVVVPSMASWFVEAQQPYPAELVAEQPDSLVYVPATGQFPIPELSWLPVYPDYLPDAELLAPQQPDAFVYIPATGQFPIPELSWLPVIPDFYLGLIEPTYPDPFTYIPATGQFPIPEHSWKPQFPDYVDDIPRLQYLHDWLFWYPNTPIVIVVPPMDSWWRPAPDPYPAIIEPTYPNSFTYIPATGQFPIPELSWLPVAPEHIDDINRLQHLYPWFFWHPEIEVPPVIPSMDSWWVPTEEPYPAELVAEQPDSLVYIPAVGQFPVPELAWAPVAPEHVDDLERLQHLYPWLFWHTEIPVDPSVSMDSWFQETEQPLEDPKAEREGAFGYMRDQYTYLDIPPPLERKAERFNNIAAKLLIWWSNWRS